MPFHFCTDELLAILAAIPFLGLLFRKLHTWWHVKSHHKCHEKDCKAEHVEHCHMPASVPHGKVGEGQCEQHPLESVDEEDRFSLTFEGLIAGTVLNNEPISIEDLLKLLPNEDADALHTTIFQMLEDNLLEMEDGKLKLGKL